MSREKLFRAILLLALLAGSVALSVIPAGAAEDSAPWTWDEAEIRERIGKVRAGEDLTPSSWPDGAKGGEQSRDSHAWSILLPPCESTTSPCLTVGGS